MRCTWYFYGSLVSRWKDGKISLENGVQTDLAAKLPSPIFDPTTKSIHDVPVSKEESVSQKLVTSDESVSYTHLTLPTN